jgi:hypothetical protein
MQAPGWLYTITAIERKKALPTLNYFFQRFHKKFRAAGWLSASQCHTWLLNSMLPIEFQASLQCLLLATAHSSVSPVLIYNPQPPTLKSAKFCFHVCFVTTCF